MTRAGMFSSLYVRREPFKVNDAQSGNNVTQNKYAWFIDPFKIFQYLNAQTNIYPSRTRALSRV